MAKAEITVHIAYLPIVQAKLTELDEIAAALRDEQPFPRTEVGDTIHNLRGRAETAELALASLRARVRALAGELVTRYPDAPPELQAILRAVAADIRATITDAPEAKS
jgi:hypothetical protein